MSLPTDTQPATIPQSRPFIGMWIGFLYILFFVTLDLFSLSTAGIFHTWVNNAIPVTADLNSSSDYSDPLFFLLYFGYEDTDILRGYIATIIVSLPIFAFLAVKLYKLTRQYPVIKNLRSRKIMIYITLIITFLIIVSNAIYAIFNFLDGNVTMNTLGHLFITLTITGSIFVYFFREVYHDQNTIQ